MFGLVADISLRTVAAAAAVGLVLVVLRVRSGAARHAAWSAVLLAMLTMPLLTAIVPTVDVPVPSTLALDLGAIAGQHDSYPEATGWVAGQDARDVAQPQARSPLDRDIRSTGEVRRWPAVTWGAMATALYAAGVLFFFVRLAGGWHLARQLVASATLVDVASPGPVFESSVVATPLSTGILSPAVVLPVTWREWPADKLAAVLAHENAHIARRDSLVALLAHVNRAIFWFHPLAWWLERTLAVTAEHACDETAARQVGQPRRYAEVLLDMAEAVRLRGHRVSWQTIGVDGSGLLGARIDRILRGDVMARMSAAQRVAVAGGCAAVLLLAIACRQQVAATPLLPDPEVQKSLDAMKAGTEKYTAATQMSAEEAAALEASLEVRPGDAGTREKLLTFYQAGGKVKWEEKLAGLRRHTLWFIANAPDHGVSVPTISKTYDPEGYAAAKKAWLEHLARADVTVKVLARAAAFFSAYDKPLAEELLLRGQQTDPDSKALLAGLEPGIAGISWSSRLGELYARAIAGSIDQTIPATGPAGADAPFAAEARRKLEATTDPRLLRTAGNMLLTRFRRSTPDAEALGKRYLERAFGLDPQNVQIKAAIANNAANETRQRIESQLRAAGARDQFDEFSDTTYAAVSALPAADRLTYLPSAAESAYMRAEYVEFTARDKPDEQGAEGNRKARAGWDRARQYAEDALKLAENHRESQEYGSLIYRANTLLGVLALRDGNRQRAVEYMERAGNAPPSDALAYTHSLGLRGRLVEYLLREGERETVARFLEQSARLAPVERESLLRDAAAIRSGVMPRAYQYAEARR